MLTNKSPGIDKIPVRVIKDGLPEILPTVTSIISASFCTEIFLSTWKIAEITHLPKKGDHQQPDSNRPILLLPILSKVCEKAALNQIVSYLGLKQRLSTEQNGKKKHHSTETSLIETIELF